MALAQSLDRALVMPQLWCASMMPNESILNDCYVYLTTLGLHHLS